MKFSRRNLGIALGAAAMGGSFVALRWAANSFGPPFAFTEIGGLDGFRRLDAGPQSRGFDPFIGIGASGQAVPPLDPEDLCGTLFNWSRYRSGTVPVASFSDYFCPYCRVLTEELTGIEAAGSISVTWHELPLLGEPSLNAARAAMAADLQGAYPAFHRRLMRAAFTPNRAYVTELARSADLDLDRFLADLDGSEVDRRIRRSLALAELLGLVGTPALIVGRTLVIGAIRTAELKRLISVEAGVEPHPCL